MAKSTILVTGATGAQGGSVAHHLLRDGGFTVRALTRNPDSDKAAALREAGAEVVQGDLADPPSLREALRGCEGVFGVTNFWEHFEREAEHGINLVDAIAEANIPYTVLSTLPSVREADDTLSVPHFETKASIEKHARQRGLRATCVHVTFYYENFLHFFPPQRQEDGSFLISVPLGDTPMAAVAVEDVGGVVLPMFKKPDTFVDRAVVLAGDEQTGDAYAEALSVALDRVVTYSHMEREAFAELGFPGAEELADMFDYYRRHVPSRVAEIDENRRLYPALQTFDRWASGHREALLAAMHASASV